MDLTSGKIARRAQASSHTSGCKVLALVAAAACLAAVNDTATRKRALRALAGIHTMEPSMA